MTTHVHPIIVYYEDTDFSGVVYHANYLKFMERAREHALGIEALVDLWKAERMGFVVYKAELTFKEPARHGDRLEIHTTFERASRYRIVADQRVRREGARKDMVIGRIELVPVSADGKLTDLPDTLVPLLDGSQSDGDA